MFPNAPLLHWGFSVTFNLPSSLTIDLFLPRFQLTAAPPQRRADPVTPCNTWPPALWELNKG